MPFNWENYINIAKELFEGHSEAHFRSSISRAYYGIYNIVVVAVKEKYKEYNIEDENHGNLFKFLISREDADDVFIGAMLDKLRINRNKADYNSNDPVEKRDAQIVLKNTDEILNMIKN
jgi:hypothetical protein